MARYVGLVRGVNVGGRRLAMVDLRACVGDAGGSAPQTLINSGNVVFDHPDTAPDSVAVALQDALLTRCALDVVVMVRDAPTLAAVLAARPFGAATGGPGQHVGFLAGPAPAGAQERASTLAADGERVVVDGRHVHLLFPAGVGRSRLATRLESALGVAATLRNRTTVGRLADLAALEAAG